MGEFIMPSLGSQMIEAKLIKWLVKPGDAVSRGDIIGEIDTEKGLIDIEVFEDGVITDLVAKEGEVIPVGSVMAVINGEKSAPKKTPAVTEAKVSERHKSGNGEVQKPGKDQQKPASKVTADHDDEDEKEKEHRVKVSPLARRVAEDLDVDLTRVHGSGEGGAIHRKDVEAYAQHSTADESFRMDMDLAERVSEADRPKGMRSAIAAAMSQSNREIPHYYIESEIDMKASLDWLHEQNKNRNVAERFLLPVLLIKAVAKAIEEEPEVNGFWRNDALHVEEGVHIGFAVSLRKGGLVIPALMNADIKSLDELREEFVDLVMRAREGHLRSGELSSATITITSLGERGAEKVYGIIYPPQVALVGFGRVTDRPRSINGAIGVRPVITAVLAGDHRATDGHTGSRFLESLNEQLQHPEDI